MAIIQNYLRYIWNTGRNLISENTYGQDRSTHTSRNTRRWTDQQRRPGRKSAFVRVCLFTPGTRTRKSGLIRGYVALLDQSSAGYPDNVFVRITLHSQQQADLAAFEAEVRLMPEVMECYLMSGDSDYLLRVIVKDARDYERVHSQKLTRLPGVDRVHSSFALRTVAKKTAIPVRA